MLTIGEFAQASGLTAKALRFYDEVGLLIPADVDPVTGYRRYAVTQLRAAATVRLLRATGMPVNEVRAALDAPDRLDDLRRAHAERVAAERDRQDRATAVADRMLRAYDERVEVRTREVAEQHWVGSVMPEELAAAAPGDTEACNERFTLLARRLAEAGRPPAGPWWTTIRLEGADQAAVLLCWPVGAPPPDGFAVDGLELRTGVLPARTEAYVRHPVQDEDAEPPGTDAEDSPVPHPAFVAFLEYCEEHQLRAEEIRQVGVLDATGAPTAIDVSVTAAVH